MDFDNILNKPLATVALIDGGEKLTLSFQDGSERSFGVEGDCCSMSWIEHLELPGSVEGAVIQRVEDSEGVPWDGHVCDACGHECLAVYNTKFYTDKGTIVLEYRNDSNGYYGGYLVDLS